MREQIEEYILDLQDKIVSALEDLDPIAPKFKRDPWTRPQGGHGRSYVFSSSYSDSDSSSSSSSSTVLEKAGVGVSIVHGTLPPPAIKQMRSNHASLPDTIPPDTSLPFFAAGISLIIHPRNPFAPTVHANYRYFELLSDNNNNNTSNILTWWFGGGSDLTPSYLFDADATHFHQTLKSACDSHSPHIYPSFKSWCDEYFHLPHRSETRGIGGIFFDDLNAHPHPRLHSQLTPTPSPSSLLSLIKSLGDAFLPSYLPILTLRMSTPYTEHNRRWQLLRRGRYVEFNLLYDRGTKFGLHTPGARVESILMSLPETARWEYMSDMEGVEGSEEDRLVRCLRSPRDWV